MIAYTSGVYDLFHIGHLNLFKRIKKNCSKLIVGVHNDECVSTYKRAPIISYADRLEIIRSCKYVDEVHENADLITTDELLYKVGADYVFAGKDNSQHIEKFYKVHPNKLILLERTSNICTSDIIKK
jgi:cytidyltransferase-like protein